jgi:heme o synthase
MSASITSGPVFATLPAPGSVSKTLVPATPSPSSLASGTTPGWRDYWALTKPKVVLLIAFTAVVGMFLATPGMVPLRVLVFGTLGIWLAAASAAAINHVLDRQIDARMARTRHRPLPTGALAEGPAVAFAFALGVVSMLLLTFCVNPLTALLTFLSLIGYAIVYTVWLKRATPQNIVIGGAAGAAPPVLGWVAVPNSIAPNSLLLFLIIFTWTPPHFWALAIARKDEYARVGIPMLPVTHGVPFTRLQILLYTVLLALVTLLPYLTRMSGLIYLAAAIVLNGAFLRLVWRLQRAPQDELAMRVFGFSITYLCALFGALLVDHYLLFRL